MTEPATSLVPMNGHRSRDLQALAQAAGDVLVRLDGDQGVSITGLGYDSRAVRGGDLFFCVPGMTADGHRFAPEAIAAGAAALCVERPLGLGVPEIVVGDARIAMARIAAVFYGRPSEALTLLGVTGTNGKTTTVYLLEAILTAGGFRPGLIGTIETRIAGTSRAGVRTTPESLDLQKLFSEMVEGGVDAVAMEVTSHALALHRVEGVRFAATAFTNLSQDHLDFHNDMDDYFAAKRSLFTAARSARGAVNLDDPYGRKIFETTEIECVSFGTSPDAQVRARAVSAGPWGMEFAIVTPAGDIEVRTSLVGSFNVYNCLAACATALQAGVAPEAIRAGLAAVAAVPGRFEAVDAGQPFAVVVDYAHTPDSLDNVLREARRMADGSSGRVFCVFGCGGDRDRAKRPLMGAVAAGRADVSVVTSDNPRSEDPRAIIGEILAGMPALGSSEVVVLPDRAEAIAEALSGAVRGDVVVIAGKGHEPVQEFADHTIEFDDRAVARTVLARLGWGERP